MRAVVTGGAGFLGSHLCDYLLTVGWEVLALDNLITGDEGNLGHLRGNPKFRFERKDVTETMHAALATLCPGSGLEPDPRQTHAQTGRAPRSPSHLVARNPEQTHRLTQLPCSWLFERMNPAPSPEMKGSSASFRFRISRCWRR